MTRSTKSVLGERTAVPDWLAEAERPPALLAGRDEDMLLYGCGDVLRALRSSAPGPDEARRRRPGL